MKKNILIVGFIISSIFLITGCGEKSSEEVSKEFTSKLKNISVKNVDELLLISEGKSKEMLLERKESCKYSSIEPIYIGAQELLSKIDRDLVLLMEKNKVLKLYYANLDARETKRLSFFKDGNLTIVEKAKNADNFVFLDAANYSKGFKKILSDINNEFKIGEKEKIRLQVESSLASYYVLVADIDIPDEPLLSQIVVSNYKKTATSTEKCITDAFKNMEDLKSLTFQSHKEEGTTATSNYNYTFKDGQKSKLIIELQKVDNKWKVFNTHSGE